MEETLRWPYDLTTAPLLEGCEGKGDGGTGDIGVGSGLNVDAVRWWVVVPFCVAESGSLSVVVVCNGGKLEAESVCKINAFLLA